MSHSRQLKTKAHRIRMAIAEMSVKKQKSNTKFGKNEQKNSLEKCQIF